MSWTKSLLALSLIIAAATLGVETCVCYVGQELDQATGKRYGWSQPAQTLCECTEFRLGGVNMKPQVKLYEMMVGGDNQIKPGMIRPIPAPGLPVSTAAPGTTQLPCSRRYTTEPQRTQVEELLDLPMRLEFSVQGAESGSVYVGFSPGTKGYQHAKFAVCMSSLSFTVYKREREHNDSWTTVKTKSDLNIFGELLFVTYDSGHIEAGVRDVESSYMTYDLPSPLQADRMFITLDNDVSTEWNFFEPCTTFTLTRLN